MSVLGTERQAKQHVEGACVERGCSVSACRERGWDGEGFDRAG
jgi:hypothetical protein